MDLAHARPERRSGSAPPWSRRSPDRRDRGRPDRRRPRHADRRGRRSPPPRPRRPRTVRAPARRRCPAPRRSGSPSRRSTYDAEIVPVGADTTGALEVPPLDGPTVAGWYRRGVSPGEAGNAVLVGHVDSPAGPAVFFDLGRLRARRHRPGHPRRRAGARRSPWTASGRTRRSASPPTLVYGAATRGPAAPDHLRRPVRRRDRQLPRQHRRLRHPPRAEPPPAGPPAPWPRYGRPSVPGGAEVRGGPRRRCADADAGGPRRLPPRARPRCSAAAPTRRPRQPPDGPTRTPWSTAPSTSTADGSPDARTTPTRTRAAAARPATPSSGWDCTSPGAAVIAARRPRPSASTS